jgi:hypothetical protein
MVCLLGLGMVRFAALAAGPVISQRMTAEKFDRPLALAFPGWWQRHRTVMRTESHGGDAVGVEQCRRPCF